jgi:hypothetical protein|tara:strand:+ start:22 stop:225 length:204 start_codon:yes stop_codon:yes gene_type:complete
MEDKNFLVSLINIIDVSSRRGTWNGNELQSVGNLRSEIEKRLKELAQDLESEEGVVESSDPSEGQEE